MKSMTSRERFAATMKHQPVDRPPIDIGATALTSMSRLCQERLFARLGLSGVIRPGNSGVDDRILDWAATDFRGVGALIDLPSRLTRSISDTERVDCWGVRRKKMEKYWEIDVNPLRDATRKDLAEFAWPEARIDEKALAAFAARARQLKADGRYVVVAEHPVLGVLELGCWMCGYDDFLFRLAGDEDFVRDFFDRVLAIQLAIVEQYYSALSGLIDLTTSGDDFGIQLGPMLSPDMFGRLIAPYFSRRIARTKELGRCHYWHHSCGSVVALLDQIIGCGVDILNPVQTSAEGMDPPTLKRRFGDRIVFWGAMDVQQFLPSATPDEVAKHARWLIETLGKDGGYVMAPAHNMQDDVPPENIVAWREEMLKPAGR